MFENFQLAAIVKNGARTRLLRVPLHQTLQNNLADNWRSQYEEFVKETNEIEFDAGYQPEQHERFCLSDYEPPDWLAREDSQTVAGLSAISEDDSLLDSVRGLVALVRDDRDRELMLFQNFTRSKIIRPKFSLLLARGTYTSTDRAGLVLDHRLSAVYRPAERVLLFHNFRTVNTFLPLSEFYKEASEQEIREVLAHERLWVEEPDKLAIDVNQWFRKRFAMLRDSSILDQFSASAIQLHAQEYGVSVLVSNGKMIFPSDKTEARKLLQFLNEERFLGALTDTLYETNSKRPADG